MKHSKRLALAIPALALVLVCTGCADAFGGQRYHETVHMTVSRALPSLSVDDAVGSIAISAWDKPSIQIDAIKSGRSADDVHNTSISAQPNGSTLAVEAHFGTNDVSNRSVDFTIHVPAATAVYVTSSVGKITIDGLSGNVSANASTGAVSVTMARLGAGQTIKLESSVGKIDLTLPNEASATIDAETSVGRIGGNAGLHVDRDTVGATAHGVVGAGAAKVTIDASTGSVNIDRE